MTLAQQLVERILGPDEAHAAHQVLMQKSKRVSVLPSRDNVRVYLRGEPRWLGQTLRSTASSYNYSFWFGTSQMGSSYLAAHYCTAALAKFGTPPDMASLYWDVLALILARPVRTHACVEVRE